MHVYTTTILELFIFLWIAVIQSFFRSRQYPRHPTIFARGIIIHSSSYQQLQAIKNRHNAFRFIQVCAQKYLEAKALPLCKRVCSIPIQFTAFRDGKLMSQ